jgi:hypothetical protein
MKHILVLFFLIFIPLSKCFSQNLFPIETNDKWGYIDKTGKTIINPVFEQAGAFSEGMALIIKDGKIGYINESGKITIQPQFETASPFSEGVAAVMIENKWGFINRKGRLIIEPRFAFVSKFRNGLCRVKQTPTNVDKWGYIDTTGKWIVGPDWYHAGDFTEGLAWIGNEKNDFGYINNKGNIVIQLKFNRENVMSWQGLELFGEQEFSEGLSAVISGAKYGYIDKTGKWVIDTIFDWAGNFMEGLAPVEINKKFGYINASGKIVIPLIYESAEIFSEGLAAVGIGQGNDKRFGFIDKKGNMVIKPTLLGNAYRYAFINEPFVFSNGIAYTYFPGWNWGYINTKGEIIWKKK